MADLRESFPTLQDSSTQEGKSLIARQEGDAAASQNGSIGFAFKDSSGNVILPQLDTAGNVVVVIDQGDCYKSTAGELAAGSATLALVTGAEITLTASTSYHEIGFVFSCRRDSLFQIVQQDDATNTVLAEYIVGPGQYTVLGQLHCLEITTGSTGTQKLKVLAKNFEAQSSLRATITAQKVID